MSYNHHDLSKNAKRFDFKRRAAGTVFFTTNRTTLKDNITHPRQKANRLCCIDPFRAAAESLSAKKPVFSENKHKTCGWTFALRARR